MEWILLCLHDIAYSDLNFISQDVPVNQDIKYRDVTLKQRGLA